MNQYLSLELMSRHSNGFQDRYAASVTFTVNMQSSHSMVIININKCKYSLKTIAIYLIWNQFLVAIIVYLVNF